MFDTSRWVADRMHLIESSAIRKMFELVRTLKDPINLSIGQPEWDVPEPIKAEAWNAIQSGNNGYTLTAGYPPLRQKLRERILAQYPHPDREVVVTSGTSGALMLALSATLNPGDEVIVFDPWFVSYRHLVTFAGGVSVVVDTYPDFDIDPDRVKAALTPRTKVILFNSPGNPTGCIPTRERVRDLARLADQRGILLLSDEVYRVFDYDDAFVSPAEFNENVLVVDGFSKAYSMTGWRLGFAHGPRRLIEEMIKLQQFIFVCAPTPIQHAGVAALDFDPSTIIADYGQRRDRLCNALRNHYKFARPQGAFYLFVEAPSGGGNAFVMEALKHCLVTVPGTAFSRRDTHFRISYAVDQRTIERGIEVLIGLARGSGR
jgi:aspartate/methionine/tyrosine aminotransferase